MQRLPVGSTAGMSAPSDGVLREPTPEESKSLGPPDPQLLEAAWVRGLRQLESRIRRRLRPHEDRMRRELHREMRTLSTHFRSLIAEERTGRGAAKRDGRRAGSSS